MGSKLGFSAGGLVGLAFLIVIILIGIVGELLDAVRGATEFVADVIDWLHELRMLQQHAGLK